jgi:hypothetical protein
VVGVGCEINASAIAIGGGLLGTGDHTAAIKTTLARFTNILTTTAMIGVILQIHASAITIGGRAFRASQDTHTIGTILGRTARLITGSAMERVDLGIDASLIAIGGCALGARDDALTARTTVTICTDASTKSAMKGVIAEIIAAISAGVGRCSRTTDLALTLAASVAFGAKIAATATMQGIVGEIDTRTTTRRRRAIGTIKDTNAALTDFARKTTPSAASAILFVGGHIHTDVIAIKLWTDALGALTSTANTLLTFGTKGLCRIFIIRTPITIIVQSIAALIATQLIIT